MSGVIFFPLTFFAHRTAISQATVVHQDQALLKHQSESREIAGVAMMKHVREVENILVVDQ